MDLTLEQGKSVRSLPPEEEGAAETMCNEMTTAPIRHPPVLLRAGRRERNGSEVEPGKKGGIWGKGFQL